MQLINADIFILADPVTISVVTISVWKAGKMFPVAKFLTILSRCSRSSNGVQSMSQVPRRNRTHTIMRFKDL